jgi:hypothetical protein
VDDRWIKEFGAAVTVCDAAGTILAMNDAAAASFQKDGGLALIGSNLLDCHPEPSRTKFCDLLASGRTNVYTITKNGVPTLFYQAPWHEDGQYRGLVEISMAIPDPLPQVVRDGTPAP